AIEREQARRRVVGDTAIEALDRAEQDVRSMVAGRPEKLAAYLVAIRRTLTPGMARTDPTPFSRALGGIERGRRQVRGRAADPVPGASPAANLLPTPMHRSRPATTPTGKPRVAVIAWDVGHNPLGRANIMAEILARRFDVELWGAQFERYGSRVWAPLRDTPIPINVFPGRPFPDHLAVMEHVASQIDADAIWVSKPRLPSYLLGALAKEHRNRPLVLDVDDHELAFFGEDEGIDMDSLRARRGDPKLDLPFERLWTQACDPLIASADQVTVSNVALQQRYGGLIVPHARDENLFDPARFDRDEVRARLGVSPQTRLLLFGGTPRVHKGVVEVLKALEELGDERYRVLMFGTRELDELRPQIGDLARWAMALPYQPFRELPSILAAADLACVLQDGAHPVARYQMPAKVTDALAMGVPCLVSPVPPLQPLIDEGVLQVLGPDASLAETIADIFDRYDDARHRAAQGRKLFLSTFSYEAVAETVVPVFEALIADPPAASSGLATLTEVPRDLFEPMPGQDIELATGRPAPRRPGQQPRRLAPGAPFDLVMFWKQNDTGIYGRRQDMVLEYLQRSGRVGTVVHFDNPITPESLANTWRRGANAPADQGRLVVRQTLGRVGPRRRSGPVHHHTFLYGGSRSRRLGLPRRSGYVGYVQQILKAHGIGERPFVLWAYPTNADLPRLIDTLDPDLVVADVVDDNRTWFTPGTPEHDRADLNYEEVLARSDLVLANCDPVASAMSRFAADIHVIPNGLELPDGSPRGPRPTELQSLAGPLIGYVGNLSSRIDIDLLDGLAEARPQWQFVFIGSAHLDASILRLEHRPNVHFLGVKPHQEARQYLRHFDVALIPHLDNEMTRAMNPLKAFVYCAAGVPVVSTPVANLGDLAGLISVAHGVDGFLTAIEQNLHRGRQSPDLELLRRHSWEQRISDILSLIDATVAGEPGQPATS
ncbi:MAG: glycosyltransferase, partial [Aquihabitans sp.]